MTASAHTASPWTLWPVPDPDVFGDKVYSWAFFFKVNVPIIVAIYALLALTPLCEWTGCDPRVLVAGGVIQLGAFAGVLAYGYRRIHPGLRELITYGGNLAAAIAIPLSTSRALFMLWVFYLAIVFFEAYGNPKAVAAFVFTLAAPALVPLYHQSSEKALMATLSAALGGVVYLLAAYVAGWTREGAVAKAARARESGVVEERARIERRLDETLGTALSEIALWHEVALASGVPGAQAAPVGKARERAREALTELRTLVAGFDHQPASMAGLAAEIQRRAGNMCVAAGIAFEFKLGKLTKISLADAYHTTMIAIEAVENAVQHASPRSVTVFLSGVPLEVLVEDDGTGFDAVTTVRGRGMRNFETLAAALGARLEIDSAAGKGTRVRVTKG